MRCSVHSSDGGCVCASRQVPNESGDTGCPAPVPDSADAAQQPAFERLILLPAQGWLAAQPLVVPAAGDLKQSA